MDIVQKDWVIISKLKVCSEASDNVKFKAFV